MKWRSKFLGIDSRLWRVAVVAVLALAMSPVACHAQAEKPAPKKTPAKKQAATKTPPDALTLERVYQSGDFRANSFSARWLPDNRYARWERTKGPNGGQDLVAYDALTGKQAILIPSELLTPNRSTTPLTVSDYEFSDDMSKVLIYTNTRRVWRRNTRGDYWVLDLSGRELRQLGGDASPSTMMFAKFSPNGKWVAYVHENDLWIQSAEQPTAPRRLTADGSETTINGTFDWVYEEELGLRDGIRWSFDSSTIAYWQLDSAGVRKFPLVNNTAGLYPAIQWIPYPKTGQRNSSSRIGLIRVAELTPDRPETKWLRVPGDSRDNYLARLEWAPSQNRLILQQLNRLQNTNRIYRVDGMTGEVAPVAVETDDAWVEIQDKLLWTQDRFAWLSDRSGSRQLYLMSQKGDVTSVTATADSDSQADIIQLLKVTASHAFYLASPNNATQSYLYRAELKRKVESGAALVRLTPKDLPGSHRYSISPNAQWAFHTYSQFDMPPTTELIKLPEHEVVRVLADNKKVKDNLAKLGKKRPKTELFSVEIEPGVTMDGWCIRPATLQEGKKYPLLVYVYGEPAGTTVKDAWGGSTQMWHRMLAQQGFVVMSFDNRGTPAPKGRAWRKSVYRQVGIQAPRDQAAAVRKVLEDREYLDATRVGVWGWSGGGSMTLNAMFKFPDLYHVGVSIAPVPNQRLYDTIYQERYMGLPSDNASGYRDGSPINFARHLKGKLLLVHGTGDDNCHYQGTEALVNELIRFNKPFSMMAYPNRSHSISEGVNTSKHLRELMTRFLKENLGEKPDG